LDKNGTPAATVPTGACAAGASAASVRPSVEQPGPNSADAAADELLEDAGLLADDEDAGGVDEAELELGFFEPLHELRTNMTESDAAETAMVRRSIKACPSSDAERRSRSA
jgi:hypothetical protein